MNPHALYHEYEGVSDALHASWEYQASPEFSGALERLRMLAERGALEAIEALAEILSLRGPHRDPEAAYVWYFIAYSVQDYTTEFVEQEGPRYMGPVGDFRNEATVCELVDGIGLDRVRALDKQAAEWLGSHRVIFTDPRDHRTET